MAGIQGTTESQRSSLGRPSPPVMVYSTAERPRPGGCSGDVRISIASAPVSLFRVLKGAAGKTCSLGASAPEQPRTEAMMIAMLHFIRPRSMLEDIDEEGSMPVGRH